MLNLVIGDRKNYNNVKSSLYICVSNNNSKKPDCNSCEILIVCLQEKEEPEQLYMSSCILSTLVDLKITWLGDCFVEEAA